MRGLRPVANIANTAPWTSYKCLRRRQNPVAQSSLYSTNTGASGLRRCSICCASSSKEYIHTKFFLRQYRQSAPVTEVPTLKTCGSIISIPRSPKTNRRRLGIILVLIGAAVFLGFSDYTRHSYAAARRTLRVVFALTRCVYE